MTPTITFWLLAGALTLAALAFLLLPLLRRSRQALARAEYDLAIYRDQMSELEREIEQGLIEGEAAERARNEIAHRILAADKARQQAQAALSAGSRRDSLIALLVGALVVPAVALAIYLNKGEPGRPDMPLEKRLAEAGQNADLPALIKRAERKLAENPDDLRGWVALAPAYEQLGRFEDAVRAWKRAIALSEKPDADLHDALGEALVRASRGRITPEALAAFRKAQEIRPGDPMSRYYIAMADLQAGRRTEALQALKALLADLPKDAPAHEAIAAQVRQLEQALAGGAAIAVAPGGGGASSGGPSARQVEEQRRMMMNASPQERQAFIRNMVESLEARLKEEPNDLGGWLRLIRAWRVLGETDKARQALAAARQTFANNAKAAGQLNQAARGLGLE